MAELLKCIVCSGLVSSDANCCPHCGTSNFKSKYQLDMELKRIHDLKQKELQRELSSKGFVATGGDIIEGSARTTIYFQYLGKKTHNSYRPHRWYYWLDGHQISNDSTLDLRHGRHTIGVGYGQMGYSECDGEVEVMIPKKSYCTIYVKYKWVGFINTRLEFTIDVR